MSLAPYDLRTRGGPRHAWRFRPRWRRPTRRELRLAAFVVYGLVLAWAVFLAPQREITRALSALDSPPPPKTASKIDEFYDMARQAH